jgi:hypothetical protein
MHVSPVAVFDFFFPAAYIKDAIHAAPTLGREALGVIKGPEKRR